MKLIESERDRKVVEFTGDEFRILMSAMGYVDTNYEFMNEIVLDFSQQRATQIADELYRISDESLERNRMNDG